MNPQADTTASAPLRIFGQWFIPHPSDPHEIYGLNISGLVESTDDSTFALAVVDREEWTTVGILRDIEQARMLVQIFNELFNPPFASRAGGENIFDYSEDLGTNGVLWGVVRLTSHTPDSLVPDRSQPPLGTLLATPHPQNPEILGLHGALGNDELQHLCTFLDVDSSSLFIRTVDHLMRHVTETGPLMFLPNPYADQPDPEILQDWYIPTPDDRDTAIAGIQIERRRDNGQYLVAGRHGDDTEPLVQLGNIHAAEWAIETIQGIVDAQMTLQMGGPQIRSAEQQDAPHRGVEWVGVPAAEDPETGEMSPILDDPDQPMIRLWAATSPSSDACALFMIPPEGDQQLLGTFLSEEAANEFVEIFSSFLGDPED